MTPDQTSGQDRTQSRRSPLNRRGFAAGLAIGLGALATDPVRIAAALAECVGPNVVCPTPDGVKRHSLAQVYRAVRNEGDPFAISDAAIRVYALTPTGDSDMPKLDVQNPILGSDGLPIAFRNLKPEGTKWRDVREKWLFKDTGPGTPGFNGRLVDAETGRDYLEIIRGADEVKDRVIGTTRGSEDCSKPNNCELQCANLVVWERQVGASNPVPFQQRDTKLFERFYAALWAWPVSENNPTRHPLVSVSDISDEKLRKLMVSGEAASGWLPQFSDFNYQIQGK